MARSTHLEKEVIQEHISSAGSYDGTESGLSSNNVLDAIDEVKSLITAPTAGQVSFTAVDGNLTETDTNVQSAVGTLDGAVRTLQTQVIGGVTYKGGYNANTNTPDLESPDTITIEVGDMYTITGDGDFYTEAVTIGDVLIAEVDSPTSLAQWTVVENNLENAADVSYNNSSSGLVATNLQTAIDEVEGRVDTLETSTPEDYLDVNTGGSPVPPTTGAIGAIALGSGVTASSTSSDSITIGTIATGINSNAVAIGRNATGGGLRAVGLGADTDTTGSTNGIALGFNAKVTAHSAVQIAAGTNSDAFTLQFFNKQLANSAGLVTEHTAVNYSSSNTNINNHLEGIDDELGAISARTDDVENYILGQQLRFVNEQTFSVNKDLNNTSPVYQHIQASAPSLEVALPPSPYNGLHFVIKNEAGATESFTVTGGPSNVVLAPGEVYEAVYGASKWMVI